MTIKKFFFLLTILFFRINPTVAQNSFIPFSYIFEGKPNEDSINVHTFAGVGRDSTHTLTIHDILSQQNALSWQINPPKIDRHDYYWACFRLINKTKDTLKYAIFTKHTFDYMKLYKIDKNQISDSIIRGRFAPLSIKNALCYDRTFNIELPPKSQADYYFNYYVPIKNAAKDAIYLLNPTRLMDTHQRVIDYHDYDIKLNNFLFNFLILLILATFVQYYVFPRNVAFLYYMGYLIFFGLYYFNIYLYFYRPISSLEFLRPYYYLLEIITSYGCYSFYNLFIIEFTEAGNNHPPFKKRTRITLILWLALIPIHCLIMYYGSIAANHYLFTVIRTAFLVFSVYSFFLLIKYGNSRLNVFIYLGSACLLFFIVRASIETITQLLNFYPQNWFNQLGNNYRFVGIRFGVIIESIFFSIGLIFKGKQLSKEQHEKELSLQKQYIEQLEATQKWQHKYQTELELEIRIKAQQVVELENEKAIERTRSQIAQDIHDEVGMHLTKIILTSELAAKQTDNTNDKKVHFATHIADEARQVVSKLKEIIFIISTEKATFYELQAYIREKTNEFWENSRVALHFDFPNNESPQKGISIDMKRHLLMIFRESQNNIAKHAQATEVRMTLKIIDENHYFFSIQDNGKGFERTEKSVFSRGLKGIYNRAESIGASASIESVTGNGTTIKIRGIFR